MNAVLLELEELLSLCHRYSYPQTCGGQEALQGFLGLNLTNQPRGKRGQMWKTAVPMLVSHGWLPVKGSSSKESFSQTPLKRCTSQACYYDHNMNTRVSLMTNTLGHALSPNSCVIFRSVFSTSAFASGGQVSVKRNLEVANDLLKIWGQVIPIRHIYPIPMTPSLHFHNRETTYRGLQSDIGVMIVSAMSSGVLREWRWGFLEYWKQQVWRSHKMCFTEQGLTLHTML